MIAPVRPRVVRRGSSTTLLLEDAVALLLASGQAHRVSLAGHPRSLVTALAHLAAVFAHEPGLWFDVGLAAPPPIARVVLRPLGAGGVPEPEHFDLQGWSDDEVLEYLMARHREAIGPVLAAWRRAPPHDLGTVPDLCGHVLDHLASHGGEVFPALAATLRRRLGPVRDTLSLNHFVAQTARAALRAVRDRSSGIAPPGMSTSAYCTSIASTLIDRTLAGDPPRWLPAWHPGLRTATAELVRHAPATIAALQPLLASDDSRRPFVWSALCLARPGFRPPAPPVPPLEHACLRQVDLARMTLRGSFAGSDLQGADLTEVRGIENDLRGADLTGADATRSHWTSLGAVRLQAAGLRAPHSSWRAAVLQQASFCGADLRDADLRGADLAQAHLAGADLSGADLSRARCSKTDLTAAVLDGTRFVGTRCRGLDLRAVDLSRTLCAAARFVGCDLAGTALPHFAARRAHFLDCDLTSASWRGAALQRASFRHSRLADVDFEGADLRGADLRDVQFHAGNSRSGLVDSTIASEGTRTGFYTDESVEDRFQIPEAVRKANLRHCDLRGAHLDGTDFYLVDLRGARLHREQLPWLRRCRALLDPPAADRAGDQSA
jgi:uncharacterized protein YjbI with pentapeptide repeats